MDIVDLTESPALSPQYKGKRRQQTEGSSPQPKKRRTKKDQTEGAGGSKAIKPPKTKPEKRTDAAGRTVRFASAASQKVQERIARAMPGAHFVRNELHSFCKVCCHEAGGLPEL